VSNEAFRLGVTPPGGVAWYTVGRAAALAAVCEDLDEGSGRMRLLVGDYGAGKSHLLAWIREKALAQGWLVGEAALDDVDVTPAQPKRLYRALLSGLRYPERPERALGLAPLLERLLETPGYPRASDDPAHHRYLDPALACLLAAKERERPELEALVVDWLEGQPASESKSHNARLAGLFRGAKEGSKLAAARAARGTRLLALPDYRTFGHVYAYVLGGLAAAARDAGWRGIALLVDEAEFYELLRGEQREHAKNVLACLALATRGPGRVCFDVEKLRRGGQPAHRKLPAVYAADQPLYAAVALTPVERMRELLAELVPLEQCTTELEPLSSADYAQLFARVTERYPVPFERAALLTRLAPVMGRALHAAVASGALATPRAVLKVIVEFLDVVRLAPAHAAAFARDLVNFTAPGARLLETT
jgi:hypothetical protein